MFVAANTARLPLAFQTLAIVLLVQGATGSYTLAGVAAGAQFVLSIITAVPLGRWIDRVGHTRPLIVSAVVNGVGLALLAVAGRLEAPASVLIACAAVTGVIPPVSPSQRSILTTRFTGDTQRTAYALESVLQETIWTAGPLIGGLALIVGGPVAMVWLAAALSVGGVLLFLTSSLVKSWEPGRGRTTSRLGAAGHPGVRTLLLLCALAAASLGQFEIAVTAFVNDEHAPRMIGVVLALWAAGSAIGGLFYGARPSTRTHDTELVLLASVCAVSLVPAAVAPNIWVLLPGAVVAGLGIAPLLAAVYMQLGAIAPSGMTTEAFSLLGVAFPAGFALGAPLAGALADGPGARVAIALSGVAIALGAVMVRRRRATLTAPVAAAPAA